jgi:hypothetical protein
MVANTTGQYNTAIGRATMPNNTSGSTNVVIGNFQDNGNNSTVTMIGINDIATGGNQMRFGSASHINGGVTTEAVVSDKTWSVFINGTAYKILLKA